MDRGTDPIEDELITLRHEVRLLRQDLDDAHGLIADLESQVASLRHPVQPQPMR